MMILPTLRSVQLINVKVLVVSPRFIYPVMTIRVNLN